MIQQFCSCCGKDISEENFYGMCRNCCEDMSTKEEESRSYTCCSCGAELPDSEASCIECVIKEAGLDCEDNCTVCNNFGICKDRNHMPSYKEALLSVSTEEWKTIILSEGFSSHIIGCPEDYFDMEEVKCPDGEDDNICCITCWDKPYCGEIVYARGESYECIMPDKNGKPVQLF